MRKFKHRESTEANLIRRLVSEGFNNCSCEITTLGGKIKVSCLCDIPKEIAGDGESPASKTSANAPKKK
jgi:hypothetical protein